MACITEERRRYEQEEVVFALVCSDDAATLQRQETELGLVISFQSEERLVPELRAAVRKRPYARPASVADGSVANGMVTTVQPVDRMQSKMHNPTDESHPGRKMSTSNNRLDRTLKAASLRSAASSAGQT